MKYSPESKAELKLTTDLGKAGFMDIHNTRVINVITFIVIEFYLVWKARETSKATQC